MLELDHLSYSSISLFLQCSASWKMKYIDKIKTPTSPELVMGSAVHGTVETFIANNHQDSLIGLWNQKWTEQLEKDKNIDWGTNTPEHYCNEGIRILSNSEVQKGILSVRVMRDANGPLIEREVALKVPGVPIPITGFIDLVTEHGIPGDIKTSKSSWSADKALTEIQPLFYLAMLNQLGIVKNPEWRFIHFVIVKTKTPQFQVIEHIHNPGQLMWLFQMVRNVWKAIESGIYPENPTSWACSSNYCGYWARCRGKYG
jgi:putative RecB family exonuclease